MPPPSASTKLSPTVTARSERRRREVCDAARRVIARKGLEATTLRDIAREGAFTTGVVTHHFPDKRSVIRGAFAAASDDWLQEVGHALARAETAEDALDALVRVALPATPSRQSEWRLWSEMWTYAGQDAAFAAQLVVTDARWEGEIRRTLARARDEGLIGEVDIELESVLLARLIDGLGLRAWLSGCWPEARWQLVQFLSRLGLPEQVPQRLLEGVGATEVDR